LLTLPWSVTINVVNDRNVMRINEVYLLCIGKIMNRESVLKTFTAKPDAVNVLSGESHKNLDRCTFTKTECRRSSHHGAGDEFGQN